MKIIITIAVFVVIAAIIYFIYVKTTGSSPLGSGTNPNAAQIATLKAQIATWQQQLANSGAAQQSQTQSNINNNCKVNIWGNENNASGCTANRNDLAKMISEQANNPGLIAAAQAQITALGG